MSLATNAARSQGCRSWLYAGAFPRRHKIEHPIRPCRRSATRCVQDYRTRYRRANEECRERPVSLDDVCSSGELTVVRRADLVLVRLFRIKPVSTSRRLSCPVGKGASHHTPSRNSKQEHLPLRKAITTPPTPPLPHYPSRIYDCYHPTGITAQALTNWTQAAGHLQRKRYINCMLWQSGEPIKDMSPNFPPPTLRGSSITAERQP